MILKAIGKNPKGKTFQNIEHTDMMPKGSTGKILKEFFKRSPIRIPPKPMPTIKTDLKNLQDDTPQIVWFGHSSYLISHKGYKILVDPVLFGSASPVRFLVKPFKGTTIYTADDMPEIDLLVLTHDHYDHMSYETLMKLKDKIKKIVCPVGVDSHLLYWGFDAKQIQVLDWNQSAKITENISMTALPARHFSGRTMVRNKTLWTSYVLEFDTYKFFLGGDSGYDGQYKITGEKYGPFDLAFLECGQYNKNWPHIHIFPEQTAQAALELKTKVVLPVHWGKFSLSVHAWNEPMQRLFAATKDMAYKVVTPKIGETYPLEGNFEQKNWWENS